MYINCPPSFHGDTVYLCVAGIMKREADAQSGGGPTNPNKRYRQGEDELRLLIPSRVCITFFFFVIYNYFFYLSFSFIICLLSKRNVYILLMHIQYNYIYVISLSNAAKRAFIQR